MNKILKNLKIDLENIYKEKLVSIILYGSSVNDSFDPKISDINLIVIIDNLSAKDLKNAYPAIKKWRNSKNPLPLFMDRQEWFNSFDVFAIECADIKERYKIIYGENLVVPITIEKNDLRLQCESEIKHILIKLRQSYLLNNRDSGIIKELFKKSSKSIIAIFRAMLRLLDVEVPQDHKEVINKLAETINFDHNVFTDILLFRENKKKFKQKEVESNIQKLIDSLEEILEYVDKVEV